MNHAKPMFTYLNSKMKISRQVQGLKQTNDTYP